MKRPIALWLLSTIIPLSVGAGELVIRETETAIIVEFNGDADDTKAEKYLQKAPVVDQAQQTLSSPPAEGKGEAVPQLIAGTGAQQIIDRNTSMIQRAEIRRKAKESKRSMQEAHGAPDDD